MRGVHSEIGVMEAQWCVTSFVDLDLNRETLEIRIFVQFSGEESRDCRAMTF
jgi:hypothetical protein